MKYGGTTLKRLGDYPQIWSGSELYYREFFLLKDELKETHAEYVLATLGAWATPGIHLVLAVRQSDMDPETFQVHSRQIAEKLYRESHYPQPGN